MDETDRKLLQILRQSGRASITELAGRLNLGRATVRARLEKLENQGTILGYSAVLKTDVEQSGVRSLMMIEIEGRGTEKVIKQLAALPDIKAIHTTNGRWDLVIELATETLEDLDATLRDIRLIDGIAKSETNLLLSTRKFAGSKLAGQLA